MSAKIVISAIALIWGTIFYKCLPNDEDKSETVAKIENDSPEPEEDEECFYYPLRGERYICPETGEELQVRAVGGRPNKES